MSFRAVANEPAASAGALRRRCLAALAATMLVGCGGGNDATVEGTVTLDGRPLDRGSVTFVPAEGRAGATATINADGSFEAHTGSVAGLQPGEYVVTVRAHADAVADPHGGPPMPGRLLTPARYNTGATSDLRATIEPGHNELTLELRTDAG